MRQRASELANLRCSLREFLAADRAEFGWTPSVDAWLSRWDESSAPAWGGRVPGPDHSARVRGQGLGHLHRYVVTEELFASGAPVAAHWIADRQVGPGLCPTGPRNSAAVFSRELLQAGNFPRSG